MYKVAILAICVAVATTVSAQGLGSGSFLETMLLSQMLSGGNNQNSGPPSSTPGARPGAMGMLGGGSSSQGSNPLGSMFGGGSSSNMMGNMGRLMMLNGKYRFINFWLRNT